jgi:hypothetical protein
MLSVTHTLLHCAVSNGGVINEKLIKNNLEGSSVAPIRYSPRVYLESKTKLMSRQQKYLPISLICRFVWF